MSASADEVRALLDQEVARIEQVTSLAGAYDYDPDLAWFMPVVTVPRPTDEELSQDLLMYTEHVMQARDSFGLTLGTTTYPGSAAREVVAWAAGDAAYLALHELESWLRGVIEDDPYWTPLLTRQGRAQWACARAVALREDAGIIYPVGAIEERLSAHDYAGHYLAISMPLTASWLDVIAKIIDHEWQEAMDEHED